MVTLLLHVIHRSWDRQRSGHVIQRTRGTLCRNDPIVTTPPIDKGNIASRRIDFLPSAKRLDNGHALAALVIMEDVFGAPASLAQLLCCEARETARDSRRDSDGNTSRVVRFVKAIGGRAGERGTDRRALSGRLLVVEPGDHHFPR